MKQFCFNSIFNLLLVITILISLHSVSPHAQAQQQCTQEGQCLNGKKCEWVSEPNMPPYLAPGTPCGAGQGAVVIGPVNPPPGVRQFNVFTGSSGGIGIINFASNLLHLGAIIAGIWVMFNFIHAGFIYVLSNGDPKAHTEVSEKLTYSAIGIMVIISAYTLAGVAGLILFRDPGFILQPKLHSIYGP